MRGLAAERQDRYVIISSDSHAGASMPAYKPYLAREFHDDFDKWSADFTDGWGALDANPDPTDDNLIIGVASFMSPYNWDTSLRQEHFNAQGITAEVVFPNTVPPFYPSSVIAAPSPTTAEEYRFRWAGIQAHNRWLVDFCDELPGRRAGLAQVFLEDVDDAVAEVRWAKEAGLRGVLIPGDHFRKLVPLYELRLDPFWAACSEMGMPVHRHSGLLADGETPETGPHVTAVGSYEGRFFSRRGLGHLILGGVFQRHPNLKFVFTEVGSSWVPGALAELDAWCHDATQVGSLLYPFAHRGVERLDLLPSEYFQRNCYLGASLMEPNAGSLLKGLSADRIMWGADYPHHEGTFPHTDIALRLNFSAVSEPDVRMMTSEAAASVYGFDLDFLQTIAEEVGPTVAQIATSVPDHEIPRNTMCPTFTGSWSRSRSGL